MVAVVDEQEVIKNLQHSWYSLEEIEKILQWYKEKLEWKSFSSEEVFEYLLQKEAHYA